MKLVVTYSHGDGFTWSAEETVPIEYESEEALAVDLHEHCLKCIADWYYEDEFKNTGIRSSSLVEDGIYYAPSIRTLEQWWEEEHVRC